MSYRFAPKPETVLDTEDIHRALHRAVVEVFTLRLNGKSPAMEIMAHTPTTPETTTEGVNIVVAESGEVRVEFAGPKIEETILNSLAPIEEEDAEVEFLAETAAAVESTEAVKPVVKDEPVVESDETVVGSDESRPKWLEDGLRGEGWVKSPVSQEEVKFAVCVLSSSFRPSTLLTFIPDRQACPPTHRPTYPRRSSNTGHHRLGLVETSRHSSPTQEACGLTGGD